MVHILVNCELWVVRHPLLVVVFSIQSSTGGNAYTAETEYTYFGDNLLAIGRYIHFLAVQVA